MFKHWPRILQFLIASFVHAQELKHEKCADIDLTPIKEPILQLDIDNLNHLYLLTAQKLYLYDCNTAQRGKVLATIDLSQPLGSKFLVNKNGGMCFAKIDELSTQIFDINGVRKFSLMNLTPQRAARYSGSIINKTEKYQKTNQIFYDSRGNFILAADTEIQIFNQAGSFDSVLSFDEPFLILSLDNKDNIYVLQQSLTPQGNKPELQIAEEEIAWQQESLRLLKNEIKENRDQTAYAQAEIKILLIKYPHVRFSPKRDGLLGDEYVELGTNYQQFAKLEKDIVVLNSKYEKKHEILEGINEDLEELIKKQHLLLEKIKDYALKDEYKVTIYSSTRKKFSSFIITKQDKAISMTGNFNVIKSNQAAIFFGVQFHSSFWLDSFPNHLNEQRAIMEGAGVAVNIYSSAGRFISAVAADPPFKKISRIAVDNKGNLYVLDANSKRLRKFQSN